ncbi:L,D-transpeptidase family protein [candidate division WWE3 bacterium]|nr:L,D-transpeptidase family protein [candidate division WWE3 bacterium]
MTNLSPFAWLTVRYVRFSWKVLVMIFAILSVSVSFTFFFAVDAKASELTISYEQSQRIAQKRIVAVRDLQDKKIALDIQLAKIETDLPGIVPNAASLLVERFVLDLQVGDYLDAKDTLDQASKVVSEILARQDEIAQAEIDRLNALIDQQNKEMNEIFADRSNISTEKLASVKDKTKKPIERLATARELVAAMGESIQQRKVEMQDAVKQIVVKKHEMKLYMFENGREIYSMPVSLGRPGAATKSGQFSILDKLGTVWSFWQIWLPQWMGIYFAGSSENGIHGLPFDKAGHTYWKNDIGVRNITYGCVMPNDENMTKLYNWAEVGIPVTVVE